MPGFGLNMVITTVILKLQATKIFSWYHMVLFEKKKKKRKNKMRSLMEIKESCP